MGGVTPRIDTATTGTPVILDTIRIAITTVIRPIGPPITLDRDTILVTGFTDTTNINTTKLTS